MSSLVESVVEASVAEQWLAEVLGAEALAVVQVVGRIAGRHEGHKRYVAAAVPLAQVVEHWHIDLPGLFVDCTPGILDCMTVMMDDSSQQQPRPLGQLLQRPLSVAGASAAVGQEIVVAGCTECCGRR